MRQAVNSIHGMLMRVAAAPKEEMQVIQRQLMGLGVPEASAFLAVDLVANPPRLVVSPSTVNFGILSDGQGGYIELEVAGNLSTVVVTNRRLKTTMSVPCQGHTVVGISLAPGHAGEHISDSVVLVGAREQLVVPIFARWRERKSPPQLQACPACGENSLFWNWRDKKFECLNLKCQATGPTLDSLIAPRPPHH